MEEVNSNKEVQNSNEKLGISDVIFQFLTKIENTDELKNTLIERNWFMCSIDDYDIDKTIQCYKKDGKIFFKNYDDNIYELDLTKFSRGLFKNCF